MNPHHVQGDASSQEPALPWWIRWCRWLWKLFAFVGTSVLLALAVNVASTWLTTSQGNIPANSPFGVLLAHWPIVLPVGCCLLLAALLTWMVSRWRTSASPTSPLSQQNRARMLDRLRQTYADLMRQSLQGAVWMDLALSEKPDAVRNAATLLFRSGNQPERPLSADTRILDAYDQSAHDLLILGAPGAGKSTLLLDLAQQLVIRAIQDAGHPLPVILPLSSWAVKRSTLQDWIAEQLTQIYDIPRLVSERWVQEHAVFPEDIAIPLETLQRFWHVTGGLETWEVDDLCMHLHDLSLLLICDLSKGTIRLHDVMRSYLVQRAGPHLPALHARLLDVSKRVLGLERWADLPAEQHYLWQYLVRHHCLASHIEDLQATLTDVGYVVHKALYVGVAALETDLLLASTSFPEPAPSFFAFLHRTIARFSHLLWQAQTEAEMGGLLLSHLGWEPAFASRLLSLEQELPRPLLLA